MSKSKVKGVSVVAIEVEIKGKRISLTMDEARELHGSLEELFKPTDAVSKPVQPQVTYVPWFWWRHDPWLGGGDDGNRDTRSRPLIHDGPITTTTFEDLRGKVMGKYDADPYDLLNKVGDGIG